MKAFLTSAMEDYLEAIMALQRSRGRAGVAELSRHLEVKMPSVYAALKSLKAHGLILQEPYGDVALTAKGKRAALSVERRHQVLFKFLTRVLGVSSSKAEEEACLMEHGLSSGTFQKLVKFLAKAHEAE